MSSNKMEKNPELPITAFRDILDKVLDVLEPLRGKKVLDVGAGSGYLCRMLADRGFQAEACDLSAERFLCPEIQFHSADFNEVFPIPDNAFDAVVSIEVVEHISNQARFFEEIIRVTKPGGLIVLSTPNILNIASRWNMFLYGYNDAAPFPLDPGKEDISMEHINPIGVPQILFYAERFGAELVDLKSNRRKKGIFLPAMILYPLMAAAIRLKFYRKKFKGRRDLHQRHIKWMLSLDNLLGRITIAVLRKNETN